MMQLNAYLEFSGQCEAAFTFYERCLGGKIVAIHKHGGTPMAEHVPAAWHDKVMHAHLQTPGGNLMGSDVPPERADPAKGGFSLSLSGSDVAEAERVFQALSENGKILMPLQQTFWAERFGMLVDQFGIRWMVNAGQPA